MKTIVVSVFLFLIAVCLFCISIRSFQEKGFLFNNAYIYAAKKERENMPKKPHYRQSAIVFLLLGAIFLLIGLDVLIGTGCLMWLVGIITIAVVIYAFASSIGFALRKKD